MCHKNRVPITLGILFLMVPSMGLAAVWTVPGDFATIQDAIDDASVVDGDTINVATGEYSNPPGTGFGPQNYAMSIQKELTIAGSGDNCDETLGTVFAPFSAGGQITNGAVWIAANNVTFKDICVDGQRNQDSGTGQEVARGFQAGGTNLAIENVTVVGTTHSCFEMNNTVGSAVRNSTCDTTVLGFNSGVNSRPVRVVDSDDLLLDDVALVGPAPSAISYHVVSFQGNNSYTVRNTTLEGQGNATVAAQWIFAQPVFYCCDPGTQEVAYEGTVLIANAPVGILLDDADPTPFNPSDFATTLTAAPGVVSFSNVDTPLLRTGLGQWNDADEFVCNVGIVHRLTIGVEERYYETEADALAAQAALGGVGAVDEVDCTQFQGACCTNGPGTDSECIELDQATCEGSGGLFLGNGTACTNDLDCEVLLVTMDSMSAVLQPDGVMIHWTTATEADTVGFRVLREGSNRNKALQPVGGFIPALGGTLTGASYELLDNAAGADRAKHYYIEDIDIFGKVNRHGPISVQRGSRERPADRNRSEVSRQR